MALVRFHLHLGFRAIRHLLFHALIGSILTAMFPHIHSTVIHLQYTDAISIDYNNKFNLLKRSVLWSTNYHEHWIEFDRINKLSTTGWSGL